MIDEKPKKRVYVNATKTVFLSVTPDEAAHLDLEEFEMLSDSPPSLWWDEAEAVGDVRSPELCGKRSFE